MENINFAHWSLNHIATMMVALAFGWKAEETETFTSEVEDSTEDMLDKVLLRVPGIGPILSERITRLHMDGCLNEQTLMSICGIGKQRAVKIMDFMKGNAADEDLEESNPGPRIPTWERFIVVQDKDLKNSSHPYAPRIKMRAHDHSTPYYTTTGDNPVVRSIDEQLDLDIPCKLMRLTCPQKDFYSVAKSLPPQVMKRLREQERTFHTVLRFMKQNKDNKALLRKGQIAFEKRVSERKIRKKHVKPLRELFRKLISR